MSTHGIGANRPPPGVPNVSSSAFGGVVTREVWGVRPIVYVPVTFRGCDDCFRVHAEPLLGNAGERGAWSVCTVPCGGTGTTNRRRSGPTTRRGYEVVDTTSG